MYEPDFLKNSFEENTSR